MAFRTAAANEYLVVTGIGIKDVKIQKKGWIYPGQICSRFDISPANYTFDVHAMSSEKLPFILPAIFTIGPKDEPESLMKYGKLMSSHDKSGNLVIELVKGIVAGETRALAAGLTMEQIFSGTMEFKQEVFDKVQLELNQFGLHIYNANIKQLVEVKGTEYFSFLGQKVQQTAANQAKVDVAEAKFKGDTGIKELQGQLLMHAAKVDADTAIYAKTLSGAAKQHEIKIDTEVKLFANQKEAEVAQANANLAIMKAAWLQKSKIAEIQSVRAASIRDAELEKDLEIKKFEANTEKFRAEKLAPAKVDYEVSQQSSDSVLYDKQMQAEAELYIWQTEARAQDVIADAQFYRKKVDAEALLNFKCREAEGMKAVAEGQAVYVKSMLGAFEGNYSAFHDYLMLDRRVYQQMGEINASAVNGLQPKISVWTTGGPGDGSSGAPGAPIADVFKMIPPLFTTIKDQTGIDSLPFLATLPREQML
ncbi:hypothetical protein KC19_1G212100 [Ceratodon purpureus]|uniref:Flotillin-like n=1 Tax=Ceratodon purpureus TaxID=3225 RepID=A0A8T0J9X5_CERPU|nr:hypothetical protein KC19_1G212100 [Ceratodon purpureus]KAG0591922.1 hypothetical protein KC19_1G212100 [Ceratodon purpureus]